MIREFKLRNANDAVYDLNNLDNFFHNFKGLGQEYKVTYMQFGSRYSKSKEILNQKKISGTIRFKSYEGFYNFSRFIQHKPLVLEYTSHETYYLDVSIDKLEKSEFEEGGLKCNISMTSLGTYYRTVKKAILENDEESGGKVYPFEYPYTYTDSASGEVIIQSDSVLESPCKIHIFGPCVNPNYTHYVDDKVVATGKINCSVEEGKKLVIDATVIPYSIGIYTTDNEYVENVYEKSDFNTARFLNLKYGKNVISIKHETTEAVKAIIEGRLEYESV